MSGPSEVHPELPSSALSGSPVPGWAWETLAGVGDRILSLSSCPPHVQADTNLLSNLLARQEHSGVPIRL